MKKIIERIIRKLGYERIISETEWNSRYRLEFIKEALEDHPKVKDHTMLSFLKLATLYEQVAFCELNDLPGDLVECGVWKGGSVGMMALANLRFSDKRRAIHLFDAFDDICEPDPEIDGAQALKDVEQLLGKKAPEFTGKLVPIEGIYDSRGGYGTIKECQDLLMRQIKYDSDQVFFHKGWFQDTLPVDGKDIDQIAILRLDADWYESTKVCLTHLYDKVVKGGFIIIDDYGRYDGCQKAVDEFLKERKLNVFLHYADYQGGECRYFIKD